MTKSDIYLIVAVVLISGSVFAVMHFKGERGRTVSRYSDFISGNKVGSLVIKRSGKEIYVNELPAEKIIQINENNQKWAVEIKGTAARVIESSCPKKICVKQGWIYGAGLPIICVPFKISLEIRTTDLKIDAITR